MRPDRRDTAGDASIATWRRCFPNAAKWDAELEIESLSTLLARAVAAYGDASAIDFRGRRITYRALAAAVEQLAIGLERLGVRAGDAVALLLPNTPFHPLAFFAVTRLGARVVHISALDAPREIAHKLTNTGARLMITTNLPGFLPQATARLEAGEVERILVGDDAEWGPGEAAPLEIPERSGVLPLKDLPCEGALSAPIPEPDAIAVLQFTGGTTGVPKAAMLTHGNLTAAVSMYRNWTDGADLIPGKERVITVLPLFHIYALTTLLLRHLREGNELLLRQRFDVETLIQDIQVGRATVFAGVPTMWTALLNRPDAASVDFSSLKYCVSGGAPMPFELHSRVERLIGMRLTSGWGMTETAPAGSRAPVSVPARPGLIGIPLQGLEMRIVSLDDPTQEMAVGEVGEIAIRGPNVFKGYLGDAEATKAAFCEGWFLTGDMGRIDAEGLFDIVDRRKNMIISSGYNVYPAAIEAALYEHPNIAEAIVIGVPDDYRGQSAKAYVALKKGATPFTLEQLTHFLADRLGRHEMPRALEFRDALPRSPAGKLLARALIDELAARGNA